MADVRTHLLQFLRTPDDHEVQRDSMAEALGEQDIQSLRKMARNEPASASAAAAVLARLLVDGTAGDEVVDAAKAAAQRAPRDDSGNDVTKLAGEAVWRLSGEARLAEPYFRRVRRNVAADPDVLVYYRALFSADSAASQLMQVLVQARRATKNAETRFEIAEEMAELARTRLGSPDRAIEVWRSVLREDGEERRAVGHLEGLYRDAGKWTALVELLKEDFDRSTATDDNRSSRIAKLVIIAELYRAELKLDAMALATLQRILDIDPRHQASLEALAETFVRGSRWNDLLAVYTNLLETAREDDDVAGQRELLHKISAIWVENLGNPQRALEPLAEILKICPQDPDARRLMATIHEQRRDWRALIALRREELDGQDVDDALPLRIDLARLSEERLGDRCEAISDWNQVLAHHGDVLVALESLSRLYERENRWSECSEMLHRRLALLDSAHEAVGLLTELGQIYADRLRSSVDSIQVWSEIARLVPGHDKALRTLRDAYVRANRWDELEKLYLDQDRASTLVDVLQGAADRIADIEARVGLYRRVAVLCSEQLGQPERALKALERTLAIQPDNLAVARELLPIYHEQSNWARVMATLEILLKASEANDDRLELMAELRRVASENLQSPSLTFQWCSRAYRLRPEDDGLRRQLEDAAEKNDGWDELTSLFEARITELSDDAEQLLLLGKLATIARDRLFKPDDAQRFFRRIIETDPSNGEAISALEAIYTATRRWEDLGEVYRRRLTVTKDVEGRLETLRALARLQEDHLRDLEGAVATYREILDLTPEDGAVLLSLSGILRNRGEWGPLASTLQRSLDLLERVDVRVLFELSGIQAERLHDHDAAVGGFLAILDVDPLHRNSVVALEDLRNAEPSTALRVMEGLLPYYRRTEDRANQAAAMEVILAESEEVGSEKRHEKLSALAGIYEKMDDRRGDALRIYGELVERDASSWEGRQQFQKLGREQNGMAAVAEVYDRVLAGLAKNAREAEDDGRTVDRSETNLRRDLYLELAAMFRDDLGQLEDAEHCYREILENDETHQRGYEALENILRRRGAHDELLKLYRRRVDVIFNPREQRKLLGRIIEIARTILDDRHTAIRTAEELLDLIPDDLPTIEILAEMYAQGEDPRDREGLDELLGRWAELTVDAGRRFELICRRAALRMQYLGDAFGAVDLLGAVLGAVPDHAQARGLLEELLDISEVQLQVASLLDPIYLRVGDHHGRIRILNVRRAQSAALGSVDEATSHLLAISAIEEHDLQNLSAAFDAARDAYLGDPRRLDSREEVERLGLILKRELELVAIWKEALSSEHAEDKTLQVDLARRIAETLDERVQDPAEARKAYSRLLDLAPQDLDLAHRAVGALVRLHLEAGDFSALVESQRALLRFSDSPEEQVRIRLEIADNQRLQLMDRVGAAVTWSEVVDLEPSNRPALDALEQLFVEEEEWARLCEVLLHRISVSSDPREQAAAWRRVGDYRRNELGDHQGAVEAFQSVLDLKVGRDDSKYSLIQLVGLNRELQRYADVEDGLRRLTSMADRDSDRVELLTDTAEIVGNELGRSNDALDLLKRVLDLAPADSRARALVRGLLGQDDIRERAIRVLMPLFEAEQNWASLLELQELQALHQPSGRRRLQALLQVARTQEEKLQDPARAFAVLCEALSAAADQPELEATLETVLRLGDVADRAEPLFVALKNTVDRILDSDLQRDVLRHMGGISLTRLGRLGEAGDVYRRVLELAPDDTQVMDSLEEIYTRQGAYQAMADLLVVRAERASDTAIRDSALLRAGDLLRKELSQPEYAIELYERLSTEAIQAPEIQDVLESLYEGLGRYREFAAHLSRKLNGLDGPALVDTHLRLGRLYGEHLDDPEEGIRHLSAALRLDPNHVVGTDELSRYLSDESMRSRAAVMLEPVFSTVQDWPRLLQIQEIKFAECEDEDERVQILTRMALLREEQLEDLDGAFDGYSRVFAERPGDRSVRGQMARLAHILKIEERLALILTRFAEEHESDESDGVLSVVREAGALWGTTLGNPRAAVPLLSRIVKAHPEDVDAFDDLENALTLAEMWPELVELYWRESEGPISEERQIDMLMKLSTVTNDVLADLGGTARAFEQVLELRPSHDVARDSLEQVYERAERFDDLHELLLDRLGRCANAQERKAVTLQISDLQRDALADIDGSVDTLADLLTTSNNDVDAIVALERTAEKNADQRARVFDILEPVYEAVGNTRRLVAVCEWRLTVGEEAEGRHATFRKLAQLLESMDNGASYAFRALSRALAEPGPEEALLGLDSALETLTATLGNPEALADARVAAASAPSLATDIDRRLDLLVGGARLRLESAPDVAASILRGALDLREDHVAVLELLDEALVRLNFHEELEKILVRRVVGTQDDPLRVSLLRRQAKLLEEILGRPGEAEVCWRALLEIEPADSEALRRLSLSYEASGSSTELIDVLERRIEVAVDGEERRQLRMRLANLFRESRKNRDAEIDVLRALLADAPSDDDAIAALYRALLAEERYVEAVDVVQERATLAVADERKASLMLDAARLYGGVLDDPEGAIERLGQVLTLVPGQEGAVADLVDFVRNGDVSETAAQMVRPVLVQLELFAQLAEVLEARADLSQDPIEVIAVLTELAGVQRERLDDGLMALSTTLRLVDLVDLEELRITVENALRLAESTDSVAATVDELASRAYEAGRDVEVRRILASVAASAAMVADDGGSRALGILVGLLDSGEADAPICESIESLALDRDDRDLAIRALEEGRGLTQGAAHGVVCVRLGRLYLEKRNLKLGAEAFSRALEVHLGDEDAAKGMESVLEATMASTEPMTSEGAEARDLALEALEPLYESNGDRSGLASLTEARLKFAPPEDRAALLMVLAEILEDGGGTPESALEAWGHLLAEDAESVEALARLQKLSATSDLKQRAGQIMLAALSMAGQAGRPCLSLSMVAARVWLEQLEDPQMADIAVDAGLAEADGNSEMFAIAVAVRRALGDGARLHEILCRAAAAQSEPASAAKLWKEAASVADGSLEDAELAIADLHASIEVDENDISVWRKLLLLLAATGDDSGLSTALGRRAMITPDGDERRELRYRLANHLVTKLEALDDAIVVYLEMIADEPEDRVAIAEAEVVLRRQSRWRELRDLLEGKFDVVPDDQRVSVLEEMARLAEERLDDRTDAIEQYKRIVRLEAEHENAIGALERLLIDEELWNDLAELYETRMDTLRAAGDTVGFRRVASELAAVLAERIGDGERAQEILTDLLDIDPSYVPAILALASVYDSRGDEGAVRLTLKRAAELDPQGVSGANLMVRMAKMATDEDDVPALLDRALELDPGHDQASAWLLEMARAKDQWNKVAHLLEMRLGRADDDADRRSIQLERCDVLIVKLADYDGALRVLAGIYQDIQDDIDVNHRIGDALFRAGRYEEAKGMYDWLVGVGEVEQRQQKSHAVALTRLARIEVGQGAFDVGRTHLLAAHRIDSTNVETLMALGDVYEHDAMWADALKIYRAMLLQNADRSGLLRRGDIYLRLSAVHLGLEERSKAQAMLRRGIEEDSSHPDLVEALARLGG